MKGILVILTVMALVNTSFAGCFPENNVFIPVGDKNASMTEAEFLGSIERVSAIYSPIFESEYGSKLFVEARWDDATANAYASQSGKTWKVAMFGGLARMAETTQDGFEAVICHEIGHHIGGAVKYPGGNEWASSEGQSDYFATSKCLKKVFAADLAKTIELYNTKTLTKDEEFAKTQCDSVFKSESEAAICLRAALAGQSLANVLGKLGREKVSSFQTPDAKAASKTVHSHPKAQCRMDTYFQGGLCDKSDSIFPSSSDVSVGYCTVKEGFSIGTRPSCWYKASEYEK